VVINGQLANSTTFNAAFMSRTAPTTSTVSIVALQNTDIASGADVLNSQQAHNETFDAVGMTGIGDTTRNDYSSNEVVTNGDDRKVAIGKLDEKFSVSTGHGHTGAAGDGAPISAGTLSAFNKFWAVFQSITKNSASGTSTVITTEMSGKTPGGNTATAGVITSAPNNLAHIVDASTQTFIEDAGGQRVYGRVTESAGVWTLFFYTNEAGTETAHSLTSTNIKVIFLEVYDQEDRPTIPSNPFEFGTLDVTADVVDAGSAVRGVLNPSTNPQVLGGNKQWEGYQENLNKVINSLDTDAATTGANATIPMVDAFGVKLTNASLTSVDLLSGAFGSNNQLFTIYNKTGAAITLNHNIGSGGFLLPGAANLSLGNNSSALFFYDPAVSRWVLFNGATGAAFSLAAFGSTPNADGASYNTGTGAFNLQPADSTNPGSLSAADQDFPAFIKRFTNMFGSSLATNSSLTGADQELPNPAASIVRLTNASLTSINMIVSPSFASTGFYLVIMNVTGGTVTLKNEAGGTAARRILTGTGSDLSVSNGASVSLVYDYTSARWRVVGSTAPVIDPTVYYRYTTAAGLSVPSSTVTLIDFGTSDFASGAEVTTGGSWNFAPTTSGIYLVTAMIVFDSASWGANTQVNLRLYLNGSHRSDLGFFRTEAASGADLPMVSGSDLIAINSGQNIDLRAYHDDGSTKSLIADAKRCWIAITKVA
jgi:hypothetical protein